jgi:DNA-binding transcriptional ArsR family regulator
MKRDVFQAIADPTRRAILMLIATQAMTPNALTNHFDLTRQAISKHIHILGECELLKQQKSGREIFYHLNPVRILEIVTWLEKFREIMGKRFDQLDDILANLKYTET